MLALVRAEAQVLVNLVSRSAGRRALSATLISLVFLLGVSWLFGQVLSRTPELLQLDPADDAAAARGATSALLVPCLVMTIWFGFGGGPRQLFESPSLTLLLTSPLGARRTLVAGWLRFGLLVTTWCAALAWPALDALGAATGLHFPFAAVLVAAASLVLPTIAFVFAIQVLLQRFFAGRAARAILALFSALGSLLFSFLLIAGGLAQRDAALAVVGAMRGRAVLPWLLEGPSRFLADVATGAGWWAGIGSALAGPALAFAGILAVGTVYRRAWENARESHDPLFRRRGPGRPWPAGAAAVVFKKELAQLLHQPSQLLGILVSTLIVVVLGASRFLRDELVDSPFVPESAQRVFLLLAIWLMAQLTVAPGCTVRMAVADGPQWDLFRASPVSRWALLRGKLYPVLVLQAWPALVAAVVGGAELGATRTELLLFAAVVPAGILWTTALTAFVGTIPPLMRPREERQNLAILLGIAILLLAMQLSVIPAIHAWNLLTLRAFGEGTLAGASDTAAAVWLIAGAWGFGIAASTLALLAAAAQLRVLKAAER